MGVYKKDNRWYIDYYQPDGKRKRETVTIPGVDPNHINRQDAIKALSIRKAQIAEGKFDIAQTDKPVLFEKLMDMYLQWAKDNHKAPERDISASKPLLSVFKGKNINSINLWHVEQYKSNRKSIGRKPETINKELGILRRMFNLAVQWKFISSNPLKGLKLLKVPNFKPRVLKDREFQKLYDSASKHFKPILLCAYMTGMRRGEIAKLRWEDVDFEDRYIHVVESKNNEARSIPVSGMLMNTLKELKKSSETDYVFTTHEGKPYTHVTVWKTVWNNALKKSGIEKCRFHDLRHTFISNLIVREKEDFATVMSISGHRDISMLKRYSHTHEEAKKIAISKLEKGLKFETMDTYLDTKAKIEDKGDSEIIDLTYDNQRIS
ncbi:tyrosine-type recombinase/integrase [Desulfobacterota bacterium AH_259_B03_O07]|nr:tyrosine-type recombinase/integrase [Desulfobacterota bacterium AH_259_B03_O07]